MGNRNGLSIFYLIRKLIKYKIFLGVSGRKLVWIVNSNIEKLRSVAKRYMSGSGKMLTSPRSLNKGNETEGDFNAIIKKRRLLPRYFQLLLFSLFDSLWSQFDFQPSGLFCPWSLRQKILEWGGAIPFSACFNLGSNPVSALQADSWPSEPRKSWGVQLNLKGCLADEGKQELKGRKPRKNFPHKSR